MKISSAKLGFAITGFFLGAGFVSGKELCEFFGIFGKNGIYGLILALVLLGVLCCMVIENSKKCESDSFDICIIPEKIKWARKVFAILEIFFYFCLVVIMTAGAKSLFDTFGTVKSSAALSGLFIVLIGVCTYFGISFIVKLSSVFVPVLSVASVIIAILVLAKYGIVFPEAEKADNPLLSNFVISAFVYVSYNYFGSVGILCPFSVYFYNKRKTVSGSIFSVIILLVIALSILLSIFAKGNSGAELPMAEIAFDLNSIFGYFYSLLLLGAMFTTSFSSAVAVVRYFEQKFNITKLKKCAIISIFVTVAYVCSMFGFGSLISIVYPIFGYIGFIIMILVIYRFLKDKVKK